MLSAGMKIAKRYSSQSRSIPTRPTPPKPVEPSHHAKRKGATHRPRLPKIFTLYI
jgi:hypothetical protein